MVQFLQEKWPSDQAQKLTYQRGIYRSKGNTLSDKFHMIIRRRNCIVFD